MTNKLKGSRLNYLLIHKILSLIIEELYKITGLPIYLSNLVGLLFRAGIANKG